MDSRFDRSIKLIGQHGLHKLTKMSVAVFGVGGVGGFTVEALARAGIGTLHIVDYDTIDITNINRQIIALDSTVGLSKVIAFKDRLMDINPKLNLEVHNICFNQETASEFNWSNIDYIVDAIDMVTSKFLLVEIANKFNIPIISAMGAGNKLDPTKLCVTTLKKTHTCPLARVMRQELGKRGFDLNQIKVVYSTEAPLKPLKLDADNLSSRREVPGSISFVPSVAGLLIASVVVNDLLNIAGEPSGENL